MAEDTASPQTPDFRLWAGTGYHEWVEDRPEHVAVDTETEGVAFFDPAFCVTMSWRTPSGKVASHYFELGDEYTETRIRSILTHTPYLVMHNAKFDLQKLILAGLIDRDGVQSHRIHDTECIAHLVDEQRRKGLKELARTLLSEDTDEDEALRVYRAANKMKKSDGYHLYPRELIIPYALKDTEFTIRLFEQQLPLLYLHDDLAELYTREQELMLTLLDMEARGMAVDLEYLTKAIKRYALLILNTELDIADIVDRPVGKGKEEFNPNSPKQVLEQFAEFGITLEATDKEALGPVDHPLAQKILDLREATKIHGTYLKPMLAEQRDGIIHPNFRQHGAKTGRMSSGGASE